MKVNLAQPGDDLIVNANDLISVWISRERRIIACTTPVADYFTAS